MSHNTYNSPLSTRYSSADMQYLFSEEFKIITHRKLWVALAESEMELGLKISQEQVDDLKKYVNQLNLSVAHEREKITRHDVMAQIYAFGEQAKLGAPIIHLGATSCFVGDNTDLIVYFEGLKLIRKKVAEVMKNLRNFASQYKKMPCLGFTHFQAAQPVTVGKRATLWLANFVEDLNSANLLLENYRLRGAKGTTGTQASFLELFEGDESKVLLLDKKIVEKMGFSQSFAVTGQTYTRKFDYKLMSFLSEVAQSASKFANDLRLLQGIKEMEEPFEKGQVGSSAMAYKRNPMRCERISSLARFVMSLPINGAMTMSTQWFERTLDDSANKRLSLAEAFLATDGMLNVLINVTSNLVVYDKVVEKHIYEELPFMATEVIIMECVKSGLSRQEVHEKIRVHSMEAGKQVKLYGKENDLIKRILSDQYFSVVWDKLEGILSPENFVGMCQTQVENYIENDVNPLLKDFENEAVEAVLEV